MVPEQRGGANSIDKQFAYTMTGRFWRDHRDVNIGGRIDCAVTNVEAVGEHEHLAGGEMRLDVLFVERRLLCIRCQNHDNIGPCSSFGWSGDGKSVSLGAGAGGALRRQSDADTHAVVAQILRVSMPLRAVTDNRDLLALDQRKVCIFV